MTWKAHDPIDDFHKFWRRVDQTPTCWLWTGSVTPEGYGQFKPRKGVNAFAHRWSYEKWHGSIPKGMHIDHLCRVRNCVNPAHLEVVTPRVNTLRGIGPSAINAKKTHCPRGHEFNEINTRIGKKGRECRGCDHYNYLIQKARRAALKAAADV